MSNVTVTILQSPGTSIANGGAPADLTNASNTAPASPQPSAMPVALPVPLAPSAPVQYVGNIVAPMTNNTPLPGMTQSYRPLTANPVGGFAPATPGPAVAPSPGPGRWPVSTER